MNRRRWIQVILVASLALSMIQSADACCHPSAGAARLRMSAACCGSGQCSFQTHACDRIAFGAEPTNTVPAPSGLLRLASATSSMPAVASAPAATAGPPARAASTAPSRHAISLPLRR